MFFTDLITEITVAADFWRLQALKNRRSAINLKLHHCFYLYSGVDRYISMVIIKNLRTTRHS